MTLPIHDAAILRTLIYADIFDFPLTPAEIRHYLIGQSASLETVERSLDASAWLAERVTRVNGYYVLRDRTAIGWLREERKQISRRMWPSARRWGYVVGCLPFVRMVAITGALAVNNSPPGDDIDLLVVTTPGRVWLGRALAVGMVYLARRFGVELCPNYVLSHSALAQERRDLFAAHDLAQMVPLVGHPVYAEMRAANGWVREYLPHADGPLHSEADLEPKGLARRLKRLGEWLLSGRFGDALETWERRRKLRKFALAAARPGSAAQIDADHVKGHFNDYSQPVLEQFQERLARYSSG